VSSFAVPERVAAELVERTDGKFSNRSPSKPAKVSLPRCARPWSIGIFNGSAAAVQHPVMAVHAVLREGVPASIKSISRPDIIN